MERLDEAVDHVRGGPQGRLIVEYGDYECPYSRAAFRQIERVETQLGERVRFAFRHFPLTEIHPHAASAATAAEAAALQGRFWEMHDALFADQGRLEDPHLWARAEALGLDLERFDADRRSDAVAARVREHFRGGIRAGVATTPTLFASGFKHAGRPGPEVWDALRQP